MPSIKEDCSVGTVRSTGSDEGPAIMADAHFHELPKSPLNCGLFSRVGFSVRWFLIALMSSVKAPRSLDSTTCTKLNL